MLSEGFNGVVLPEVLFRYRIHRNSMFRKITAEKLLLSNAYIARKHKSYYEEFSTDVIGLLNANGPGYACDNPTFESPVKYHKRLHQAVIRTVKQTINNRPALRKIALRLLNLKWY
jgi:hypothetical protein